MSIKDNITFWSMFSALTPFLILIASFAGSYAMIKSDSAVAQHALKEQERRISINEDTINCIRKSAEDNREQQVKSQNILTIEISKIRDSQTNTNRVVEDLTEVLHSFEKSINNINIILGRIDERWRMVENCYSITP